MTANKTVCAMLLMSLVLGLTGCIVIPIPKEGRKATAGWRAQAASLTADGATREEVIRRLGTPAWDFPDLGVIGYQWSGVEWSVLWLAGGGYTAGGGMLEPNSHRALWLHLDGQDRVLHSKLGSLPEIETRTEWERARRWRETLNPPLPALMKRFERTPPPPGKTLVHILWDKGHVDSFVEAVRMDTRCHGSLRKGAFTTLVLEPGQHEIVVWGRTITLELAKDEVCFLSFHPGRKTLARGTVLERVPETEAVKRLKKLSYCK